MLKHFISKFILSNLDKRKRDSVTVDRILQILSIAININY